MGKGPAWTEVEVKFLIECIEKGMENDQISSEFHIKTKFESKEGFHYRTTEAVRSKRKYLLKSITDATTNKPANHNKPWSDKDDIMLMHYDSMDMSRSEMAEELERTEFAVESRLNVLKNQDKSSFMVSLKSIYNRFSNFSNSITAFFFGDVGKQGGK